MRILAAMSLFLAACGGQSAGDGPTCEETCVNPQQCGMTCKGENYDVDNNPSNCCEVEDWPTGNHLQTAQSATYIGSFPCDDGASDQNITGRIPSDQRVHANPAMSGFNTETGAAPDYVRLLASGGFCINDINLSLQIVGSTIPSCYRLSAITSNGTYDCQTSSGGTCSFAPGARSYGDGTDIYIKVEKTCGFASRDNPTYTVTGHL